MQLQFLTLDVPDESVLTNFEETLASRTDLRVRACLWRLLDNDSTSGNWPDLRKDATFSRIIEQQGSLLRYLQVDFHSDQGGGNLQFIRQMDGLCQVTMSLDDQFARQDASRKTDLVVAFLHGFKPYERSNVLQVLSPAVSDAYDQMRQATARLMDLNSRITQENDEFRRSLERNLETARTKVEGEYQSRKDALEAEYARKANELKAHESALEERKRALDDRDNTHARRQKQEDLSKKLQEYQQSFKLTRDTATKRHPVHYAFIGGLVLLGALVSLSTWYALQPPQQGVPFWWPPVRAVGYGGGFVGLLIYYIRWQATWAQAHADEEFSLKRLELDGVRASWLVEVLLEWQREGKGEIPPELVQKLGANLFSGAAERPGATHPAEDLLASLLGSSSSLQLDLPHGKASFDRKAIERARGEGA